MARDFVKVDAGLSTQKYAPDLIRAIKSLKDTQEEWRRVASLVSHMNDGSNYDDFVTLFGIVLPASGTTAAQVAGVLTGVVTAMDVNAINLVTGGRIG